MVYEKYKRFAKGEISVNLSEEYTSGLLSDKEKHITDYVLDTFGIYNAWFLKDLTHGEEPWKEARGDFLYWTVNGLLDFLNQVREFAEKIKDVEQTNMLELVEYCFLLFNLPHIHPVWCSVEGITSNIVILQIF